MIPCHSLTRDSWGPSPEQLTEAACIKVSSIYVADYREEVISENEDGEDSEDADSAMGSDDELLATVEEFALMDEYHNQLGSENFGNEDWDWDDALDLDPPSSPSKRARR
jgi:hypothetical protein